MEYFSKIVKDGPFPDFLGTLALKIWETGYSPLPRQWQYRTVQRSDPYFRLYYIKNGCGSLACGDGFFPLESGMTYLIPANFRYAYDISAGLPEHYWVHFYSDQLGEVPFFNTIRALPLDSEPAMRKILSLAGKETETGAVSFLMNRECRDMVSHFLYAMAGTDFKTGPTIPDSFRRVADYMAEHYSEPLKIEQLEHIAGETRNGFPKLFRQYFGKTPKRHLCDIRINQAKILLLRTALSTKEIARSVGYDDEFFFYRIFRRYAGVTPSEYRRSS